MTVQPAANSRLLCSVIVPVFNGETVITGCLTALSSQSLLPSQMEVIVVDDGSTDDTAQRVADWIIGYPGAATLVRQANSGPAGARNHGASVAQGRYLLFTDADCIPTPDWAKTFVERFAQPDHPTAIMGCYRSSQSAPAAQFAQFEFEQRYALMQEHPVIDVVATYSAAYRREIFLAVGGFDASLIMNEDVDLAYRLSTQGHRLVFAPDAVVEHHHHESWLGYARTKMGRGFWRTLVYRRFPQKAIRDSYTPQILKAQLPLALLAASAPLLALALRSARPLWLAAPFLITATPTMVQARRRRSPAPYWALWGVWLRSLALATGVAWGLLAALRRQHAQRKLALIPQTR